MGRGGRLSEIRYRKNRLGRKFYFGPKTISDYGSFTYQYRLVLDDYGSSFDPRYERGDVNTDGQGDRP